MAYVAQTVTACLAPRAETFAVGTPLCLKVYHNGPRRLRASARADAWPWPTGSAHARTAL